MSCFVVDRNHIRYVVAVAEKLGFKGDPSELGRKLWRENYRSFNFRYPSHQTDCEDYGEHDPWPDAIDFGQARNSVKCYRYQSCEHPAWGRSYAAGFTESLLDGLCDAPDRGDYEWGAPQPGSEQS